MSVLFTQHAVALTGPLILPSQAFDSLYSLVENISAAPALRNSAAASAAPMPKHPRTPQGTTTCRVIRQPSQHAYSAAASAAPTSKRPSIPKRGTRRLTIGESSPSLY